MAIFLTRRLLNPKSLSLLLTKSPNPLKPSISIPIIHNKPFKPPLSPQFSLSTRSLCSNPEPNQQQTFQHQEIEGPTVERDLSNLANETRQVLDKMQKSIYDLSTLLGLLGVANLGLGAWILYNLPQGSPHEISIQGIAGFAFPFATAFLMRRSLKPMIFFRKMEEMGRLQILTLALQQVKGVDLLLRRTRVVAIFCVFGVSAGSIITILTR